MNIKVIVDISVVTAVDMIITPAILDTNFADKGGERNDNAYKSCEKHPNQKKCAELEDDDDDSGGVDFDKEPWYKYKVIFDFKSGFIKSHFYVSRILNGKDYRDLVYQFLPQLIQHRSHPLCYYYLF